MGKQILKVDLKQLPTDPLFWDSEYELLLTLLFPYIRDSIYAGALNSYTSLSAVADLGIAWDLINSAVIPWAEKYTAQVVGQISKTSMAAFLDHFEPWVNSGEPLQSLIDTLSPYYGPIRAEMVAVTEVTRAFHSGNVLTWQTTGMVEGYTFHTVEDERVCPICSPLDGQTFQLDDVNHAPPQHVRCRCYTSPAVSLNV